jgi:benzil reductase ((S)-benzoin forming)
VSDVIDTTGKIAVITGASRGLGAGMARRMAERGLRLGLCARSTLDEWESIPEGAVAKVVDTTDPHEVERFTHDVVADLGPIDLWVANAGVLHPIDQVRDTDPAEFARNIEINVLGTFTGDAAFVRHRREVGPGGVLVNISSGAGRKGYSGWGAYCASKAAIDRLSECLALEEGEAGLRVHSVAPGVIDTGMQAQIRETPAHRFPAVQRFHDLKANDGFATTQEVADQVLALAFDTSRHTDEVLLRF